MRFEHRFWDGSAWTEHVGSNGLQGVDPLNAQQPAKQVARKSSSQVRKSGAVAGFVGGGTLFNEPILVINQVAKRHGSNVSYVIYDQFGKKLGSVEEVDRWAFTKYVEKVRAKGSQSRKYRLQIRDALGQAVLEIVRPEKWPVSKSALTVLDGNGEVGQISQETYGAAGGFATLSHAILTHLPVAAALGAGLIGGSIVKRRVGDAAGWAVKHAARGITFTTVAVTGLGKASAAAAEGLDEVGHVRFSLETSGVKVGTVRSTNFHGYEFEITDSTGTEIAHITNTWAGWVRERFTSADHYVLQMHAPVGGMLCPLIIASSIAIDVALKEKVPNKNSGVDRRRR